jgi:hypothetical protein
LTEQFFEHVQDFARPLPDLENEVEKRWHNLYRKREKYVNGLLKEAERLVRNYSPAQAEKLANLLKEAEELAIDRVSVAARREKIETTLQRNPFQKSKITALEKQSEAKNAQEDLSWFWFVIIMITFFLIPIIGVARGFVELLALLGANGDIEKYAADLGDVSRFLFSLIFAAVIVFFLSVKSAERHATSFFISFLISFFVAPLIGHFVPYISIFWLSFSAFGLVFYGLFTANRWI